MRNSEHAAPFSIPFAKIGTSAGHVVSRLFPQQIMASFLPPDPALHGERNVLGL